ncbi:MAG: hypothetical protein ACRD4B_08055 [Acidobacteriota bacterium]
MEAAVVSNTKNEIKQIHVKLTSSLHKTLKVSATLRDKTIQDYVVEAIEEKITRDDVTKEAETRG